MKTKSNYIPALRWRALTPFYDPLLRWVMQEKHFKKEVIRLAQIQPGQQVLDLGCGTATLTIMIKKAFPNAAVTGIDGDPEVLQIAHTKANEANVKITFDQGLAYSLPYPNNSFDCVISSLMFHHLTTEDKLRTMQEVYRVLRPGGHFILADFGRPRGLWAHIISPIMAMLENVADNHKGLLITMMESAGFKVITDEKQFSTAFGTLQLHNGRKLETATN